MSWKAWDGWPLKGQGTQSSASSRRMTTEQKGIRSWKLVSGDKMTHGYPIPIPTCPVPWKQVKPALILDTPCGRGDNELTENKFPPLTGAGDRAETRTEFWGYLGGSVC